MNDVFLTADERERKISVTFDFVIKCQQISPALSTFVYSCVWRINIDRVDIV